MKHILASSLLWASALVAAEGPNNSTRLPRSTPEAQGIPAAVVLDFVDAAEERIKSLHSFMLVRHGSVIAEGWWAPYAADLPHEMYSLSKSFTSTAVGLAIADGKFGLEDPVLKFFPEEAPEKASANLRAMRVRDLLTMSTGHHAEDIQAFPWNAEESLVKQFLALPVTHKPGTLFVYNTPATYMLSAIVQKTTGQTVLDYLRPRLFEPLGIASPTWEASKQGVSFGGFGLSIKAEDIARFGQLYLQKGQWHGRQLVPADWVEKATSRWMSNGSNPASDWEQGYGFQFWRCRYGVFRGDGAHGQFCVVFPELDAVLAITSGTKDLQGVLNVVWAKLLPALQAKSSALAADAAADDKLRQKLAGLSLRPPAAIGTPALAKTVAGKRYVFPPNAPKVESIMLTPVAGEDGTEVRARIAGEECQFTTMKGGWKPGELRLGGQLTPMAASAAWTAPDTFTIEMVRTHTPFSARYRLVFHEDHVELTAEANVGPGADRPISITGRVE